MKVFNTLTRRKEELIPRDPGKISMYVCGPTAYNYIHIGNARTFLNFDVIRRYLEFAGFELTYVRNITDIDDKIINRAHEEGISPSAISEKYTRAFEEDMQALGVKKPDIEPRATEHVPDMIEVISVLEKKGYAYVSEGNVYFEVSKFPGYGKLAGRSIEEADVSSQSKEEIALKKNPFDFALWKASKPGEPAWDSPWGPGRPGWHIECSTMSVKYLGNEFDIHGGGSDLIFPHHENEIAQA
ncbi:MAG: cysteine--tRNA ligase, partial [Actinomycetota bacterium]|nr:cysteine--tRNA ligase [Actinomycetota bacterium]